MPRIEKEWVVKNIEKTFKHPEFLVFTGYQGLKSEELTELRKDLAKAGSSLHVVKNTLAQLGAKKAKREDIIPFLDGPVAVASSSTGDLNLAKFLVEFAKLHPFLVIKGGIFKERVLTLTEVNNLAKLPSREVLLSQVISGLLAPVNGFVFTLKGLIYGLVGVLKNIEKQKT